MKKIVFFTQNLKCGGVQKSVTTLANSLKKQYKVYIVLAENNQDFFYDIAGIEILEIEMLKIDTEEKNIGLKLFEYRKEQLEKLLEPISPNLVISYEDYNNLILLSTNNNYKKLISVRNCISNLYKEDEKIHLLERSFYLNNITKLYPIANKVISVSKYIQNEIETLTKSNNVITIYNGIKEDIKKIKYTSDTPYILNVARINKRKGHEDLIKAFFLIKDKIPHDLIIIGDGILRNQIKDLIKKFDLSSRVHLLGITAPKIYIQNCDLFVFPSKSEGFSNSILEVMSERKNIISYNYKGASEILPKENLIECDKVNELADKIFYFINNESHNSKSAEKLYKISKKYSLEKTIASYKKEIEKLCVESLEQTLEQKNSKNL